MTTGALPNLSQHWTRELVERSAIDPGVVTERGYQTLQWGPNDTRGQKRLAQLEMPTWARSDERSSGLLIPMYRATGERISCQWRPEKQMRNRDGKHVKYASPRGQTNRLDVHPRNRNAIADPKAPLWITEGVKKADSLTSRGLCVVALTGVFNWRSRLGTLGDWEDVPLKGRTVVLCFDADARTNMNVLRAMVRLGRWCKSKRAASVCYLIVPGEVNGTAVKGADDYLAAGGTVEGLIAAIATTEPSTETRADTFTDARLAETVADDVLDGSFAWCKALGWLAWDGLRWAGVTEETVIEAVRQYALSRFADAVAEKNGNTDAVKGWHGMLSVGRERAVLTLARGIAEHQAGQFDADPDLLNTPGGVVDLTTGTVSPHDPALLMTKITRGSYRPGYRHPDWEMALAALPPEPRGWFQARIGQGITGHTTPDGIVVILQGSGENGKGSLTTDGLLPALGDYAAPASAKLITSMKGDRGEHSTEIADLRGQRLMVAEEMTENRALDVATIKRTMDVGTLKARYVHKDNMTFRASHSLFMTTNYVPRVDETDHGTWRRLALLRFPYTYRKANEPLATPNDRRGDPGLKKRIELNTSGQHDAIVTWAAEGAVRVAAGPEALLLPPSVTADTLAWRCAADRILGYWTERLIPDPQACALTDELLADFNQWLGSNHHQPWAKETFGPKFSGHSETLRHGVEQRRQLNPAGLVRAPRWGLPTSPVAAPARQVMVWRGVRYRTPADDDQQPVTRDFAEVADLFANHPKNTPREGFTNRSATGATKITQTPANGSCGDHPPGAGPSALPVRSALPQTPFGR